MLRALAALALAAAVLGLVAAADTPVSRYQEYPCHYAEIFGVAASEPVDVMVFGNSRSMRAVVATQLEQALGTARDDAAAPVTVLDLSRSWRGQAQAHSMIRDALTRRTPKLLLLEYNRGPGAKRRYHPRAPLTMRASELLALAFADETNGVLFERLSWAAKQLLARSIKRAASAIVGEFHPASTLGAGGHDERDCTPVNESVYLERNARRMTKLAAWRESSERWDFDRDHNEVMDRYTDRIIGQARAHGVRVVLYAVPRLGQSPLAPGFADAVRERFGVEFLSPPATLMATLYEPGMFRDPTHMTRRGSALFAEWLATALEHSGAMPRP